MNKSINKIIRRFDFLRKIINKSKEEKTKKQEK